MVERIGDLELDQDLRFEKREFVFQKIGMIFMAVLVAAALLGFFGSGPVSLTEVGDSSGTLTLVYDRFGRRGATTNLTVQVDGSAAQQGEIELWVSSDYLDRMTVEGITPEPDRVASSDDGQIYTFLVAEPDDPLTVNYNLTIDSMGRHIGRLGLNGGETVEFTHYLAP